jgi:prepilin signal peptidase PulO-like enzyme (type II secretory pathway)
MNFLDVLPFLIFFAIAGVLIAHTIIDLRHWILPDKLNIALALLMITLHWSYGFEILSPLSMIIGAVLGGGFLYAIRAGGNAYYKTESMGLGDVKLLAAAGLGLGAFGVIMAITFGAMAGLVHGLTWGYITAKRDGRKFDARQLKFPAGPGFCVGISIALFGLFQGWWNL